MRVPLRFFRVLLSVRPYLAPVRSIAHGSFLAPLRVATGGVVMPLQEGKGKSSGGSNRFDIERLSEYSTDRYF